MPSTTGASKRFELPKLDFKFGSLTDGTDIPPPLPSPVQEVPTPPQTPRVSETKESDSAVKAKDNDKTNGHAAAVPGSPATTNGTKGFSEDMPLSPTLSSRQGSIRRLFSRTLLNQAYAEGDSHANANGGGPPSRPMSRNAGSIADDKKTKRTSGWFKRLRSSEPSPPQRRSSTVYEHPNISETSSSHTPSKLQSPPVVQGPPPPMIPELSALQAKLDLTDGGSLGDDLFKNIK
ncbi:hypothetical protein CGRA01v4_08944 [Colletotrichum graminicola]|uniref:Uncharacterized protein n=1 Tax=Colletotrichum graminicola (strain M1.001 / M2 / FGSC 10212) TaxID=645133 RepID=E3Q7E7_COLGM|nr:uncharacterized protein GLRG_02605 [Colletotrichum graminicola M1.001]EFQ26785.1 hypothetical protein GLRG_02605 [Colletotrichum graminicola M1.001]WDK17661.1 hypothetical protein CGRA01v4_08944 [Colletotrichum graminicola]